MIIALSGFMGCGKSEVGKRLHRLLSHSFNSPDSDCSEPENPDLNIPRPEISLIDLDTYISEHSGRTIPEIFEKDGEAAFRAMELAALLEIVLDYSLSPSHLLLSLGGGTLMTGECANLVHEKTYCIYLRAGIDYLVENLENASEGRPMLRSEKPLRNRIEELLNERSSVYEAVAHLIIDVDGKSEDEVASEIYRIIPQL